MEKTKREMSKKTLQVNQCNDPFSHHSRSITTDYFITAEKERLLNPQTVLKDTALSDMILPIEKN